MLGTLGARGIGGAEGDVVRRERRSQVLVLVVGAWEGGIRMFLITWGVRRGCGAIWDQGG